MIHQEITIKYGKIISLILLICLIINLFSNVNVIYAHNDYTNNDIQKAIEKIIEWKKSKINSTSDNLFSSEFIKSAGTTSCDWYAIAMGRIGLDDDYFSYITLLKNNIEEIYNSKDKEKELKPTDLHRISLAILSLGENPETFIKDKDGNTINLISDGIYNNTVEQLGKQGVNSYIWALILLNSKSYDIHTNSEITEDLLIDKIMEYQLESGGFKFGDREDVDITAMALQALSHYNENKDVSKAIEKAINWLSKQQTDDGDFKSYNKGCSESTAQVITSLCTLGISPVNDTRFIKNGNNVLDGLMKYQLSNGSFTHTIEENSENSTSSEQALCSFCALYRYNNNMNSLFDFSDGNTNIFTGKSNKSGLIFNESDLKEYKELGNTLTTENYTAVLRLYNKLNSAENKSDFPNELNVLKENKIYIESIQNEINSINGEIAENLYPIENIKSSDKKIVDDVISRAEKLSEFDKGKITELEEIKKAEATINSKNRGIIICIVLGLLIIVLFLIIVLRIKKRKSEYEIQNDEW